jgi:peptide/nickel transport system permease protein
MPRALRRFLRDPGAVLSTLVLVALVITAAAAPLIAPHEPNRRAVRERLLPPMTTMGDRTFILGTDAVGRDVLSRIVYGSRVTLYVGAAAVVLAMAVGVAVGLASGFFGGWLDTVLMRVVDVQLAIPFIVLAIVVAGLIGTSLTNIVLVLGLTGWPDFARVVRGVALSLRRTEYVEAAIAAGAGNFRIAALHVLPGIRASITVLATLALAKMLIAEASLSFLGLGVPAGTPTWGLMISEGREYLVRAWWISAFPGIAILITVMAVNLLGDAVRDALDPRSRG